MLRNITIAAGLAAFALTVPASAHYQHYQDPGAAIAGGLLGLGLGAAMGAAQQQQQTPPLCEAPDGEKYYATPINGEWQCEED
jgi:hypothetical protein